MLIIFYIKVQSDGNEILIPLDARAPFDLYTLLGMW